MLAAAATGGWLLAAEDGTLVRANLIAAAAAAVLLAAGLVPRRARHSRGGRAPGGEYVAVLGFEDALDTRAPLVAGALFVVAELGYWSLELRGAVADEPGTYLRRVALLARCSSPS